MLYQVRIKLSDSTSLFSVQKTVLSHTSRMLLDWFVSSERYISAYSVTLTLFVRDVTDYIMRPTLGEI